MVLPLAAYLAEKGDLAGAEKTIEPIDKLLSIASGQGRTFIKLRQGFVRFQLIKAKEGPEAAITYLPFVAAIPTSNFLNKPDRRW